MKYKMLTVFYVFQFAYCVWLQLWRLYWSVCLSIMCFVTRQFGRLCIYLIPNDKLLHVVIQQLFIINNIIILPDVRNGISSSTIVSYDGSVNLIGSSVLIRIVCRVKQFLFMKNLKAFLKCKVRTKNKYHFHNSMMLCILSVSAWTVD